MASPATATQVVKLFGVDLNKPPPPPPTGDVKLFGTILVQKAPVLEEEEPAPALPLPATDNQRPKRQRLPPPHPQELPREFRDLIASKGVDRLELILGRRLTNTDMKKHHNRLPMPQHQINNHGFLKPDEQELVQGKRLDGKRTRCNGIEVTVVDPSLKERTMTLARWNADKKDDDDVDNGGKKKKSSWWYALSGDWIKIAGENHLQAEDALQIWSFRFKADGRLGFIVHKVQPPPPEAAGTRWRRERQADGDHKRKKKKTEAKTAESQPTTSGPSLN